MTDKSSSPSRTSHVDGWLLYCDAFRSMFNRGPGQHEDVSVAAIQVMISDLTAKLSVPSETACRDTIIEECAKVCESERQRWLDGKASHAITDFIACATAIRALKNAAPQPSIATVNAELSQESPGRGGAAVAAPETTVSATPQKWVVWAHEHQAYWPASRCGYVPLHEAGHFTFEEALAIVRQGNYGMGSAPEETMMPAPGRPHG